MARSPGIYYLGSGQHLAVGRKRIMEYFFNEYGLFDHHKCRAGTGSQTLVIDKLMDVPRFSGNVTLKALTCWYVCCKTLKTTFNSSARRIRHTLFV